MMPLSLSLFDQLFRSLFVHKVKRGTMHYILSTVISLVLFCSVTVIAVSVSNVVSFRLCPSTTFFKNFDFKIQARPLT